MPWRDQDGQDQIQGERRGDRRYDIALELRWKLVRRRKVLDSGFGRTVDLSSGGVRFDAGRLLPVGMGIELSIAWPALLHNVAPMRGLTAEELRNARTRLVPLGRESSPEECAALIWFLLSDEAAYMTGQAINFTGGLVTW